jgi:hypothetical protein
MCDIHAQSSHVFFGGGELATIARSSYCRPIFATAVTLSISRPIFV